VLFIIIIIIIIIIQFEHGDKLSEIMKDLDQYYKKNNSSNTIDAPQPG